MYNRQAGFTIDREIGVRLRAERRRLGLNQRDMAALGGVELNSQSAFETSKRLPSTEYLLRSESAGLDPSYVLTGHKQKLNQRMAELSAEFDRLPAPWQETILLVIKQAAGSISQSGPAQPQPFILPKEPVLVQMFEALLLGIDPQAELDEQAQLLARRLPIALSQVQDVLPDLDRQPDPKQEHASDPASRAKHRHEPTQ